MVKSGWVQARQYRTNLCQLAFPVIMIIILFIFTLYLTSLAIRDICIKCKL